MKRSERESKILTAAKKCFIYSGYQETGMRDIAKEAGVALGTLYSYYKNKEDLFAAIDMPELKEFTPKRDREKEFIFYTAINLFSEKGYSNVTMQNIADECNINRVHLYTYFKNKEDLFKTMVLENSIVSYTDWLDDCPTSDSLEYTLSELARNYFLITRKKEQILFLSEIIRNSEKFPELMDYYYNYNMAGPCIHLTKYIQRYCADRHLEVKGTDWLRKHVAVFIAALQNYFITRYVTVGLNPRIDESEIIKNNVDVFMAFLKLHNLV